MNKQVAGKIGLSEITVKVHRGRVMQKMGAEVSVLADLVRMGEALGLRPPGLSNPSILKYNEARPIAMIMLARFTQVQSIWQKFP